MSPALRRLVIGWLTYSVVLTSGLLAGPVIAEDQQPNIYALPLQEVNLVGQLRHLELVYEDTLAAIARENGLGLGALIQANPDVDPWLPEPGSRIVLPTAYLLPDAPRSGLVVNLSERRLYHYDETRQRLSVYPIGIGREGAATPVATTQTVMRIEDPSWNPPESIRAEWAARGEFLARTVPPGPDNPFGKYAIKLALPGYFLHGTNQPMGVGQRVSHGCIRLRNDHIGTLIQGVPNGTPVHIISQSHKVAWHNNVLYLESHKDEQTPGNHDLTAVVAQVIAATRDNPAVVDWRLVTETVLAAAGVPVQVARSAG
ncbi:MAG: L,D-transpeptidase family protein [Pseudomonadota bacterium]